MRLSDVNKYVLRRGEVDRDRASVVQDEKVQPFVFERAADGSDSAGAQAQAQSTPQPSSPAAPANEVSSATEGPSTEELEAMEQAAFQRGLEEGTKSSKAQLGKIEAHVGGAIDTLHKALQNTEQTATRESIRLAVMLAEKLVRRTLNSDPEALAATLTSAVEAKDPQSSLKVLCDRQTANMMRSQISALTESLEIKTIEVEEDQTLGEGDLMIFQGDTTLDARVSTRLSRLEKALTRELGLDD